VAYSPDGKRLASASSDKTVKVWDAQVQGEPLLPQGQRRNPVFCSFSPNTAR
jgi:WD40 repeat protein